MTNSPSCSTINSNDEQRQCRRSSCACHVALSDVASSSSFCVVDVAGATSVGDVALPHRSWCGGCGRRKWTGAGGGWCDDDVVVAMRRWWRGGVGGWTSWRVVVVVVEEGVCLLMTPKLSVGKRQCSIWTSLGTQQIPRIPFRCNSVEGNSCIPAEFEFHSKFRQNCFTNLAGHSAKIHSSGIPGIARIPPDSGQNQWRTIKTSNIITISFLIITSPAISYRVDPRTMVT
jgi:hypothetical protein